MEKQKIAEEVARTLRSEYDVPWDEIFSAFKAEIEELKTDVLIAEYERRTKSR